ncbi:MAG: ornithine cyclodeaminase family protein, partial [Rhodobacteraceae bacterium]|nr:ornithine cyclodeaminase family protein [Paracoccaceae bacterium]
MSDTLTLSRPEIEALLQIEDGFDPIKDAYIAVTDGRCDLPPVGYLGFPDAKGDCHIKYGHIAGDSVFVIKIATGFYDNPSKGLASSNGIMLALSAETGEVMAILQDEGYLTDLRTGIGAALATKAGCRGDAQRVGVVGTGIQARIQIRCLNALMPDAGLVFSVWGRSEKKMRQLAQDLAVHQISVTVQPDLETLCVNADILLTTTAAKTPLIRSSWISDGTHITASGADAPGKQELESALTARADLLILDSDAQCIDHGEVAIPAEAGLLSPDRYRTLGKILSGQQAGRSAPSQVTIADLTGLGSQDIA